MDNLIRLSDIYKLSVDELVRKNSELKTHIDQNERNIKAKNEQLQKVNTSLYQNVDEGIMLTLLALASALLPPVGIFLPIYVIWRNTKYNSLYKTIIVISICVSIFSIIGTYSVISDNWIKPSQTTVYKIN